MKAPTKVFSIVALSFLLGFAIPAEAQIGGRFDAWSAAVSADSDNVFRAGEPDIPQVGKVSCDAGTRLTRDPATVSTGGIERAASREASRLESGLVTLPREARPRLKEAFEGARALALEARPVYLAEGCKGDEALRHEVELLQQPARAAS
jgi:hypothetical protein